MADYEITMDQQVMVVAYDVAAQQAKVGKREYQVETTEYGARVIVDVNGKSVSVELIEGRVYVNGEQQRFTIQKARPALLGKRHEAMAARGAQIKPPMPGRIASVDVKVGDKVATGQGLLVLEAMKMQNEVVSPVDGMIKALHCKPGDNVESQTLLVEIE